MILTISLLAEKINLLLSKGEQIVTITHYGVIHCLVKEEYTNLGTGEISFYEIACYYSWNETKMRWDTNK